MKERPSFANFVYGFSKVGWERKIDHQSSGFFISCSILNFPESKSRKRKGCFKSRFPIVLILRVEDAAFSFHPIRTAVFLLRLLPVTLGPFSIIWAFPKLPNRRVPNLRVYWLGLPFVAHPTNFSFTFSFPVRLGFALAVSHEFVPSSRMLRQTSAFVQRGPLIPLNPFHRSFKFTHTAEKFELPDAPDPSYVDLPRPRERKSDRKPFPTPMKLLIRRAKEEREARNAQPCRMLEDPPDNGLLVPDLVDVAQNVYLAWNSLRFGISKLLEVIPIQRCRFCFEVHIGHVGHEIRTCTGPKSGLRSATHVWRKGGAQDVVFFPKCYHLYDRVGKPRVGHEERYVIPRIPALLELCIQAGVDLEKYPSKRRTKPVYSIEGRIVDFESVKETNEVKTGVSVKPDLGIEHEGGSRCSFSWKISNTLDQQHEENRELMKLSIMTLNSWVEMVSGAKKIMEKYRVQTCGYCPEVQVGPKGHKVRICRASKHQSRNGLHAWQEATIDDIVGPNHVWHARDLKGPPLDNKLKRFYGKVPAVVELCLQAGAPIPYQYRSMLRLDVVPPHPDEVDLVA